MLDLLPEASLGFRSILLQICFVNQAFLGQQFFQVQGRKHALEWCIASLTGKRKKAESLSNSAF
jgi:hypothetical protein